MLRARIGDKKFVAKGARLTWTPFGDFDWLDVMLDGMPADITKIRALGPDLEIKTIRAEFTLRNAARPDSDPSFALVIERLL